MGFGGSPIPTRWPRSRQARHNAPGPEFLEWPTMAGIGRRKGDTGLLLGLAQSQTGPDAARAAGIGERTATRRLADPDYDRRILELRSQMLQGAMGKVADAMSAAADTLRQLLTAEADTVKLGAARSLLELGAKLQD